MYFRLTNVNVAVKGKPSSPDEKLWSASSLAKGYDQPPSLYTLGQH